MLKKSKTGKILIPMLLILSLFFGIILISSANGDDKQLDNSKYDQLPAYSLDFFDEIKKNPQYISSRGSFPEALGDDKKENLFLDPVYMCWSNITEVDQFFTGFTDFVIGFNYASGGYLVVELESDSSEKVNETTIDAIYQRIDSYCEQEGVSEVPVVFMWSHIDKTLPLPDYGPESFERARNETGFITTRGTMPVITYVDEKAEWIDLLVKCSQPLSRPNSTTGINPYFVEFGGPVNGFGTDINGYLIVGFEASTPEKVNESVIDEIYQVIDEHCEQDGIHDVPVVFIFSHTTEDLAAEDGSGTDEEVITVTDEDGNYIDNESKQKNNEKNNQAPGFTSILVVLGVSSLLIAKRL
ncbi:hypothetical protein [Methanosarcina sp. WWM596]|uniref:hypothetical protein n=1 Tax=Methanosarcina sp. WWM596 TaxID=1434103 RepID=UPI0006154405|nr:hypothetical protein [Methanosarcina sp. WWM596]AKB17945.1 hypothetical protein MSWHS_1082 [Methanosarcina sp. WWM596]